LIVNGERSGNREPVRPEIEVDASFISLHKLLLSFTGCQSENRLDRLPGWLIARTERIPNPEVDCSAQPEKAESLQQDQTNQFTTSDKFNRFMDETEEISARQGKDWPLA
jgi:hypothetical protein